MSLKLKALGLGLLATLAIGAVAVMNASATTGGHFVSAEDHTIIEGFEEGEHALHLKDEAPGADGEIGCDLQSYTGTTNTKTVESVTITPSWSECYTTGSGTKFEVHENGCTLTFTVAANTTSETEQTVHLLCPPGKAIEVTHPNCKITIHPQTINPNVKTVSAKYTHQTTGGINWITLDTEATFSTTKHGLCQFVFPTNGSGKLVGSVTVEGFNTAGERRSITAT